MNIHMTDKNNNDHLYKEIYIDNIYSKEDILKSKLIIENAGIICSIDQTTISCKFDEVDIKLLENKKDCSKLINDIVDRLHKIRSFSTANGKIVYASFNKNRKVDNRDENRKKRLAYEYYKKDFDTTNNLLSENIINKIYCADSLEFLKTLPDNCIDIVLTSPPYNFGINYNSTTDANPWENYFNILFKIFNECIRVLKDGGRFIVNVQPMFSDYIPTHHIVSKFFIDAGLIWKGEIIWEKNNYNCKYCTWGSWKSPAAPYLKYTWEFIEVFCKNTLKKHGDKEKIDISPDEFKQFVYAKWSIAPERNMKTYRHDAMFPEKLVERCLKLFSYQGDIVLDPFNGAGTTTTVANRLKRKFIGIDIDKEYCKTATRRIKEPISLFAGESK